MPLAAGAHIVANSGDSLAHKAKQFWKEKLLSSFLFRRVSKGLDLASKKTKK